MELIPPAPGTLSSCHNYHHHPSTATTALKHRQSSQTAHNISPLSSHAQHLGPDITKNRPNKRLHAPTSTMFMPMRSADRASAHQHVMSAHHVEFLPADKHESTKRRSREQHKGIPPAVAALLAVTAIPSSPRKIQRAGRSEKLSLDIYVQPSSPESNNLALDALLFVDDHVDDSTLIFGSLFDNEPVSLSRTSSSAALSVLLRPPQDFDDKDSCSLSVRSSSSESVPSLDEDTASVLSWSGPTTPNLRPVPDKKSRVKSPPPEDCALDHPLLFTKEPILEAPSAGSETTTQSTMQGLRRVLSFKSNLTASIRVLKSAAKSFSSFSAPLIQPDDMLTRSIFSNTPRYADEKRPRPSTDIPTAALRRYLNPVTSVAQESHCTGAIQMQTYNRVRRTPRQKNRPVPLPRTDEGDTPRPREPRENSDFLRVIVLEMNMRRGGKLSDTAQGKARLVLPPRQVSKKPRVIGDLPRRWEILACE